MKKNKIILKTSIFFLLITIIGCGKKKEENNYVSPNKRCEIEKVYFDKDNGKNAESFFRINVNFKGHCPITKKLNYQWFINDKLDKDETTKLLTKGKYNKGDKVKVKVGIQYNGELIEKTSEEIIVGNIAPTISGNDLSNENFILPATLKFNLLIEDRDNDKCSIKCPESIYNVNIDPKNNLITWDLKNYKELIKNANKTQTDKNIPPSAPAQTTKAKEEPQTVREEPQTVRIVLPLEIYDGADTVRSEIEFDITKKDNKYYIQKIVPVPS